MTELLDERVVEMRFDNKDFESNVNQSIKTIDKLKKSLDFKEAGEAFDSLSSAAEKCDLSGMEDSVNQISVKFNMLEAVAAGVLTNIANKAIDAGTKLVKSMTVDQITAGWKKYEEKTQSVQTIMAATKLSIDEVNSELEKLIWFADETSYSFTDMVNNVGKFTSAGVDLDKAVDSMMGISNWAALSGAGIQQASRAMFNLSQAMGIGYVGLMDWKSIELANMATIDFKESVIETALALGNLRQEADGTVKTLDGTTVTAETMRSTLNKQWFTSEVLTEVLKEYSKTANDVYEAQDEYIKKYQRYVSVKETLERMEMDGYDTTTKAAQAFIKAQEALSFTQVLEATADAVSSGWMRTFELIFGNYEKAKKLWTELANDMWDIFAGSGEKRNDMLQSVMDSKYQQMLDEMPDGTEFNQRLSKALYDMGKKYGRSEQVLDAIFEKYDSIEAMLQDQNGIISEIDLSEAFGQLYKDYAKDAKTAESLSTKLDKDKDLLKNVIVGFAHGYYGKDLEEARKRLEDLGWTNLEQLEYYAEQYASGMQLDWNEVNKDFKDALKEQKETYTEFANYLSELNPFDGFFSGLLELGGRDKLQAGFSSIIKNLKNTYRLVVEIVDSISTLFGGNSFLGSIIDGFYRVSTLFTFSDGMFEETSENVRNFITKDVPNWFDRFLHGVHTEINDFDMDMLIASGIEVPVDFMIHENGLIDNVKALFHEYFLKLPAEVAAPIENARQKVSAFFSDVQVKIAKFRDKYIPKIGERIDFLTGKTTKYIASGGIFDIIGEKIRGIGDGLGGKVIDGITNFLKKIGDWLVGYEKDGEVVKGHITYIYDKVLSFIGLLKTIGKHIQDIISDIKTFFFGGKYTFSDAVIYNIFDRLGLKIEKLKESKAYKAVSSFFFGEKDENGIYTVPNIFSKIGKVITDVAESPAYKAVRDFLFGNEKNTLAIDPNTGEYVEVIEKIPNVFERIGNVFLSIKEIAARIASSPAYETIHDFLFGNEKNTLIIDPNTGEYVEVIEKIPNIFERIGNLITSIKESAAYKAISSFFFGEKDENGIYTVPNIFGKISQVITNIVTSPAYNAVHDFLFGNEKSTLVIDPNTGEYIETIEKIPSIFERINNVITSIKESDAYKAISSFFFGEKDENGIYTVPNIFGKIGKIITAITESPAFKAIRAFFFGEKDENGEDKKLNIFGKIKRVVTEVAESPAFKAIKTFLFGDGENKKSAVLTAIENIKNGFNDILESAPFKAIWKFFFGDEPLNDNIEAVTGTNKNASGSTIHQASYNGTRNPYQVIGDDGRYIELEPPKKQTGFQKLLSNISKTITKVTNSKPYKEIKKFIFGEKAAVYTDTGEFVEYINLYPSIVDRFKNLISGFLPFLKNTRDKIIDFLFGPVDENGKRTENIFKRLPGYINNAWNALKLFFAGGINEKTGDTILPLLDRLKIKFEQLKAEHPWIATFCSFIEEQIQKIKKLFDDAGGSITLALSNLNSYLFGGEIKKKNPLTGEVEILEEATGLVTEIKENIYKLFHGGKEKKDKSIFSDILNYLGIGQPSFLSKVGRIILTLLGLNALFSHVDFGNLGRWGFHSALQDMVDSLTEFAKGLLMLSAAFVLMFFASKLIKKDYKAGIIAITIVGLLSKFLMDAMDNIDDTLRINPSTMITIRLITDAITQLTILVAAFTLFLKIGNIGVGDLLKAVGIISALFLLIGITVRMMTRVAKEGQQIKTAGATLFGIAAVLYSVANLITTLAITFAALHLFTKGKDFSEYANALELMKIGLIAIAAMIVVIALSITLIGTTSKNINAKTIGLTATLMYGLVFLCTALAELLSATKNIQWQQTAVVFGGLSLMLLSMSACIAMLAGIKRINKSNIAAIAMLPLLIAACGAIVYGLSVLSGEIKIASNFRNLAVFFMAMGAVIIMMLPVIGMFALISKAKKSITDETLAAFGEIILGMIEIATVITLMQFVISRFGMPKISELAAFFGSMVVTILLMLPLIGVFKSISNAKYAINNDSFAGFGLLVFSLLELVPFIAAISYVANKIPFSDWNHIGEFLAIMVVAVISLKPLPEIMANLNTLGDKLANSNRDLKELGKLYLAALVGLVGIAGAVFVVAAIMSRISTGSLYQLVTFLILMKVLVNVLKIMPQIYRELSGIAVLLKARDRNIWELEEILAAALVGLIGIAVAVLATSWALNLSGTGNIWQLFTFLILMRAVVNALKIIPSIFTDLSILGSELKKQNRKIWDIASYFGIALLALAFISGAVLGLSWMAKGINAENIGQIAVFLVILFAVVKILEFIPKLLEKISEFAKHISNFSKNTFSAIKTILGVLATIIGLSAFIVYFTSKLKEPPPVLTILKYFIAMAGVLVAFVVISKTLDSFSKQIITISEKDTKKIWKYLAQIGAVIVILSVYSGIIYALLSKIPEPKASAVIKFSSALVMLTGIAAIIGYAIIAFSKNSSYITKSSMKSFEELAKRIGVVIAVLIAAISIIALVVSLMPNINWGGVYLFLGAIAAGGIVFFVISKITDSILKMSKYFYTVDKNDIKQLSKFIGIVTTLLLLFTGLVALFAWIAPKFSNISSIYPLLLAISSMGVMFLALSGLVTLVSLIAQIGDLFGNISNILKVFGVVTIVLAAITGVVAGLAWVSKKIENLDSIGSLLVSIIKVAAAILALSVIVTAIGVVATIGKGVVLDAAIFMAEIIVVITIIGLIVAAIGWVLGKIEEVEAIGNGGIVESINKFGDMFEALMNALGKGIGGFVGGIGEGLTDSMPLLAANLSDFMVNLSMFLLGISALDETHRTGIGILVDVMAGILGAEFYGSIATVLSYLGDDGDLITVITNMKTMVENDLIPFLGALKDIKEDDTANLGLFNEIMKQILVAEFFNKIAGILEHLGPEGDLPGVISSLKTMVINDLKPLLSELKGIKEDDKNALDLFNEIMLKIMEATFLDKVTSIIQKIGGEDSKTSKIVKGFKDLYENDLRPFIDNIKETLNTEEDSKAISDFSTIMLDLMGAEFLDKVTNLIYKIGGEDSKTSKIVKGFKDLYNNDLRPFITTLQENLNIDEDKKALGDFNQIMLDLMSAEFFDKVTNLISKIGGEDSQTAKIVKGFNTLFTNQLRPFLTNAGTITDSDRKAAGNFVSIMQKIFGATFYAKISDIFGKIGGNDNLGSTIGKLKNAVSSSNLEDFLTEVRKINKDDPTYTGYFTSVMENITGATFYNSISSILGSIGNNNDLKSVITKMKEGVTDLQPFLEAVEPLDSNDSTKTGYFVSIMEAITGATFFGMLSGIILDIGDDKMSDVFSDMGDVATNLSSFLGSVQDISAKQVTGTKNFTSIMESLTGATFFGKISSFISSFGSDEGYEQYKTDLLYLAECAQEMSSKVVDVDADKINSVISSIKSMLSLATDVRFKSGGIASGIRDLFEGETNFKTIFDSLFGKNKDGSDGILAYLKDTVEKIDESGITNEDLAKIKIITETITAVFDLLAYDTTSMISSYDKLNDNYDATKGMYNAAENIRNALTVIKEDVITEIIEIYNTLKGNEVDANLIKDAISPITELLKVLNDLSSFDLYSINVSEISDYVVEGLAQSLESTKSTSRIHTAAVNLGIALINGLMEGTDSNSPSKAAYAVGQFVAQGLYNGISAGEPMNYKLAQMFGENTIASLEKGLSQHTFNMVTMDLVDENIFNMPDFMDEIGNIDFDKMSAFLHEKFEEALGSDYIDGFIGQMRKDWKRIPETLDEARTEIVQRISAGDFGSGQDAILEALEEELGSVDAAASAWEDYNNVLSENVRMNEALIKQRKENPPMTYEEYMEMVEHAQEGLDLLNSGEIDRLAAQNGTTREQELARLGYDGAFTQRLANDYYSQFFTYLTEEQWADMKAARDYAEDLISGSEKAKKVVDKTTESLESEAEAVEAVSDAASPFVGSSGSRKRDLQMGIEVHAGTSGQTAEDLDEDTSKLGKQVVTLTDRAKESLIAASEKFGGAGKQAVDEAMEAAARASAENGEWMMDLKTSASDAKDQVAELAEEVESFDDSFNFKKADEWITNLRNGTETLTGDAVDQLEALRQEIFTKGSYFKRDDKDQILYGVESQQYAIQELQARGLTTANARWLIQEAGNFNFKQANDDLATALKTQKEIAEATTAAGDAAEKSSDKTDALAQSYETFGDLGQAFTDSISFITDDKSSKITIDLQSLVQKLTPSELHDFFIGISDQVNLSDYGIEIDRDKIHFPDKFDKKLEFNLPEIVDVQNMGKDQITEFLKYLNGGSVLGAFGREFTVSDIINTVSTLANSKDKGVINTLKELASILYNAKTSAEELSTETIDPEVDTSDIVYLHDLIEEYKRDIDDLSGKNAVSAIKNGKKVTAAQQEILENMYYNAVLGYYGQNEKITEALQKKYGITWEELQTLFLPGGHFDTSYAANPYLEYADKINAQIQEGSKDYTTKDLFQDIANGLWGTDEERREALKAANYDVDKILPAFNKWYNGEQNIDELGEHYGRLSDEEREAKEETERLNEVLNATPEGAFKAVGDFLKGVESAIKDTGNADKFNEFITDVVGKLNTIQLPNASAFESIGNFLKMVKSVSNGSTGITNDFGTLMKSLESSINSVEFKTDQFGPLNEFFENLVNVSDSISNTLGPFTNFLDDVINISESNISDNAIEAAETLVTVLTSTFIKHYDDFTEIGRAFIMRVCAGMISQRGNLISTSQTLAGTILNGFKEHAIDKARQQGMDFATEFSAGIMSPESIEAFDNSIKTLFHQNGEEAAEGVEQLSPGKAFAEQFITDFSEGLTTSPQSITASLSDLVEGMTTSLGSLGGVSEKAQESLTNLADGLRAGLVNAEKPLREVAGAISGILESMVPDGYSMGLNFAEGLAMGIKDGMAKVFTAGFDLGGAAGEGVADAGKIASPSRVFMQFGRYMSEGLAIGMNEFKDLVYDAGYGLGDSAIDGSKDSLDINSPSRREEIEVGYPADEGMARGIINGKDIVCEAGRSVANELISASVQELNDPKNKNAITKPVEKLYTGLDFLRDKTQQYKKDIRNVYDGFADVSSFLNSRRPFQKDVRNVYGGFADVSSYLNSLRSGNGGDANSPEEQMKRAGEALKNLGHVAEEQADLITKAWDEIMKGDHGVVGPNHTGERDIYLRDQLGGLTWETLYGYSDGKGHLDRDKLLKGLGLGNNGDTPIADMFADVYNGKYGGGSEWYSAILKAFGNDEKAAEAFRKAFSEWWITGNDVKTYEDAEERYYEILEEISEAAETVQDEIPQDIEVVITPVVDMDALNTAHTSIDSLRTEQLANRTARNVGDQKASVDASGPSSGGTVVNNTFNQTNNSPMPLNRSEIYRLTNSQFAQYTSRYNGNFITGVTLSE